MADPPPEPTEPPTMLFRTSHAAAAMVACVAIARAEPPALEPNRQLTPLDAYVAAPDASRDWEIVSKTRRGHATELVVRLTSQTWRTADEVSTPVWRHLLTIVAPDDAIGTTALLYITGGSHSDEPDAASGMLRRVAIGTKTIAASLRNVPGQPQRVFDSDEPDRDRYEDDLLAASWNRFIATEDPTWIAQFAMAKAGVAAMDAVQSVVATVEGAPRVERFTVAGASKRGWTTWLVGAVDDRVAAIAPIVIDLLNIRPSMRHHLASYGGWSRALRDYERQGLADRLFSPEGEVICALVDPYAYRDRLTMPKCLINASGDQFFLPDSSRYYFADLVGEKHLSYTPNSGHGLSGTNALETLLAFHHLVARGEPRPTVTWTGGHESSEHVVRCSGEPIEATLWRAVNPTARDFRIDTIGEAFQATPLEPEADGAYRVAIEAPAEGFSATFARFAFDVGAAAPFRVSTPVWVAPDVEPFAETE